jgi:hypothetical protein
MCALAGPNLAIAQVRQKYRRPQSKCKEQSQCPLFRAPGSTHIFPGNEPPASGPKPVLNTTGRADGTSDIRRLAGDYTNPIGLGGLCQLFAAALKPTLLR